MEQIMKEWIVIMDDERWNEPDNKRQIMPRKKETNKVKWMIKDKSRVKGIIKYKRKQRDD